jgi:hypothetical protein
LLQLKADRIRSVDPVANWSWTFVEKSLPRIDARSSSPVAQVEGAH